MRVFALLTFLAVHTAGVFAAPSTYYWVDWNNGAATSPSGYTTTGTITTPTTTVNVNFQSSANIHGIQYGTGGDIDYWRQPHVAGKINPYVSAEVANEPTTNDIIRLGQITTVTITFSTPVVNPVLAIISTNTNTYVFDSDFEILSSSGEPGVDNGYWGNGAWDKVYDSVNNKYKLVTDMGSSKGTEPHGTIMLIGSFETIQWTTLATEYWHGFTLGVKSTRAEANIQGDPQFVGLQGQSYQVHGADDTVFALLSTPRMQMNGLFTYIGVGGDCNYNDTMCWSHPGTYISQLGFRVAHHDGREDKLLLVSGPHSQGLRMEVNGKAVSTNEAFFLGSSVRIHMKSASTVHVHIHDLFIVEVTNSDNFFNMGVQLLRRDWLAAGAKRVKLTDKSPANALSVYPQVELHGLLGITWRNVVYPHNRVYEGDVMDYAMESHDMFDTNFVYTQFL